MAHGFFHHRKLPDLVGIRLHGGDYRIAAVRVAVGEDQSAAAEAQLTGYPLLLCKEGAAFHGLRQGDLPALQAQGLFHGVGPAGEVQLPPGHIYRQGLGVEGVLGHRDKALTPVKEIHQVSMLVGVPHAVGPVGELIGDDAVLPLELPLGKGRFHSFPAIHSPLDYEIHTASEQQPVLVQNRAHRQRIGHRPQNLGVAPAHPQNPVLRISCLDGVEQGLLVRENGASQNLPGQLPLLPPEIQDAFVNPAVAFRVRLMGSVDEAASRRGGGFHGHTDIVQRVGKGEQFFFHSGVLLSVMHGVRFPERIRF